ncbi:zinc finger protein 862-like [Ruditapes philippinarum]|uniref:zinc finger protein 862-like n=1 Tax=Ruditapes philippinarum TaxID=129788 RepID=UPI00295AA559|nr:zinc finger protein 862-like [Ruditapes philippinarum]
MDAGIDKDIGVYGGLFLTIVSDLREAQLRTAFFVARNNLPLRTHNKLIDLQRENGCEVLQDKSTIYTSNEAHDQMIDAINEHISDLVKADILSSDFVGVIVDETTDISIHKKLNIYFKCFKANTTETVIHFIDCVSVRDGKAETLVNAILEQCSKLGLDMLKLVSMASDGAKVMTGHKGGVGALLRKSNPRLVQVHCVAHRLALCAGQACKETKQFAEYHKHCEECVSLLPQLSCSLQYPQRNGECFK